MCSNAFVNRATSIAGGASVTLHDTAVSQLTWKSRSIRAVSNAAFPFNANVPAMRMPAILATSPFGSESSAA